MFKKLQISIEIIGSDSCINNVKLSLNCTKDYNNHSYPYIHAKSDPCLQITNRHSDSGSRTNGLYSKYDNKNEIYGKTYADCYRKISRAGRISLDNVSANPWGKSKCNFDNIDDHSSLRRSRSLASSGEQLYSRLEFYTNAQEDGQLNGRRSQLIPRAKLIKEHNRYKNLSVDNLNKSIEKPDRYKSRRYSNSTQTLQELTPAESLYFNKQNHRESDLHSYSSLQNIHENTNPQDSLESNLNNNSSLDNISYEDLPELSLPNYYPEARYDTDNTDNISLTDNISSVSFDNAGKYKDIKFEKYEYESISYDENIVLTPNKNLYESRENKIRTIRNPTPFNENYGTVNPNPIKTPEVLISEEPIEEIDTNLDEINLKVENITHFHLNDESNNESVEVCPDVPEPSKNSIKTVLEVSGKEEEYKSVVTVDSTNEKESVSDETKSHSHNYLREFLESQKGSKKPLQNFIAKKLSNLSRKTSKSSTNLTENQFYSLPDITVSKNLRKCEKIDRKLRKCNKNKNQENRFIVNIGRHFDITADTSPPVDFEVKIAKVSKKNKNQQSESEQFLEAVKQLKDTLSENRISNSDSEMALLYCQNECNKELQEKIGTMKNYWNKVMGNDQIGDQNDDTEKVVEITPKVEEVKKIFETNNETPQENLPNKVQLVKQIFEPKSDEKSGKISPNIKESCSYFENKTNHYYNTEKFQSLCPSSVEIIQANKDVVDGDKPYKSLKQSHSINGKPEFDHVRYKLIKSDLFQKKIFANCDKECEFDDLIQYLQDYSFQELLVDNNIVIIEPIRSKVSYEPSSCVKNMKNVTASLRKTQIDNNDNKSSLNRKFYYHPIRVNKEVNEDELPSPDTVRQVRQIFEAGTFKSKNNPSNKENDLPVVDPDKDRCSATDSNSHLSNASDFGSQENLYDSIDNNGIFCEYVSEDILEKIRERGTSVTYYGGRVVDKKTGQSILTKTIMDEIKFNEKRCMECPNCKNNESEAENDGYMGVKFKILKSNSCSSRLELVGTENLKDAKKKILSNYKNITVKNNLRNRDGAKDETETSNNKNNDKDAINENIKKQSTEIRGNQPKIIAEEMKVPESRVTQWKEISEKTNQKIYNFYEFDKIPEKTKKIEEMEFEPYEVA